MTQLRTQAHVLETSTRLLLTLAAKLAATDRKRGTLERRVQNKNPKTHPLKYGIVCIWSFRVARSCDSYVVKNVQDARVTNK
jgi:hypothetical protein